MVLIYFTREKYVFDKSESKLFLKSYIHRATSYVAFRSKKNLTATTEMKEATYPPGCEIRSNDSCWWTEQHRAPNGVPVPYILTRRGGTSTRYHELGIFGLPGTSPGREENCRAFTMTRISCKISFFVIRRGSRLFLLNSSSAAMPYYEHLLPHHLSRLLALSTIPTSLIRKKQRPIQPWEIQPPAFLHFRQLPIAKLPSSWEHGSLLVSSLQCLKRLAPTPLSDILLYMARTTMWTLTSSTTTRRPSRHH